MTRWYKMIKVDGGLYLRSSRLFLMQNCPNYSEKIIFRCLLVSNLTLMFGFTIIVLQARWSIGALTNKESNKLLWKIPCFVAVLSTPSGGLQARQCHYKGIVSPGGENLRHHAVPGRAGHPPRHWGGLGSWWSGHPAKVLRIHSEQYERQTHQFGVHRPYRW